MAEVYFYHLTREPLEQALPRLVGLSLSRGWRVAVRMRTEAALHWMDDRLWTHPADGFLPHGLDTAPNAEHQPVLLTTGTGRANRAEVLMACEGADLTPADATHRLRLCLIFDGNDPAELTGARTKWKALTGAGLAARYWSQEGGRWELKAEAAAKP